MKRLSLLLLLLPLLLLFSLSASAAEPEEYVDELYGGLPSLSRDALPDELNEESLAEAIGIRHLAEVMLSGASEAAPRLLRIFLRLLGMALLLALFHQLGGDAGGGARVAEMALSAASCLLLYESFSPLFAGAVSYLSDMAALSEHAAPIMGALYAAGGNIATAAASGGVMAALSLLLEFLCGETLLPLIRVMLGFLLVSSLGEVRTDGVMASLRNLYMLLIGFFSVLIAASQAFGNALGSARDSFSLRTLKFAVGQMLPVVGGTVSGSLGTAMASLGLLRGTAGVTVAAAVLLPLLPIVTELLLSRLGLGLLAGVSGMLGATSAGRLFSSFRSLFDLVLAAVSVSSLLFLFIAASFARCAPVAL